MKKGLSIKKCQKYFANNIKTFSYYENGGGGWLWFETGRCPTLKEYELLIKYLGIEDVYRDLFKKPVFNFNDVKLPGKSYNIKREKQKIYGVNSQLGKYKNINRGRNPVSVLKYNIIQTGNEYVGHPTQKPIALIRHLIKASSNENDCVLDCFMGGGTTAVACRQLKRNFIGFEISKEYCSIANQRLAKSPVLHKWINTPKPKNTNDDTNWNLE